MKRVCIISNESDHSTADIIDWIHYFKQEAIRINISSNVIIRSIEVGVSEETIIEVDGKIVSLDSIYSFWYRRGKIISSIYSKQPLSILSYPAEILDYLREEAKATVDHLYYLLECKKSIGSLKTAQVNKLSVLNLAKLVGLTIPETVLISSKERLIQFKEKHCSIICKAIAEAININHLEGSIKCYTEIVGDKVINDLPDTFPLTLFQPNISKFFELRIFYLDKVMKSMALFSQNDKLTKTDFRNYNISKPNRTVPYDLPEHIKTQISLLMNKLNLNCGSIDMIYSMNNDYVFLEVNPVGQFGMTSLPCNYNIEKNIAQFLTT